MKRTILVFLGLLCAAAVVYATPSSELKQMFRYRWFLRDSTPAAGRQVYGFPKISTGSNDSTQVVSDRRSVRWLFITQTENNAEIQMVEIWSPAWAYKPVGATKDTVYTSGTEVRDVIFGGCQIDSMALIRTPSNRVDFDITATD